LLVVLEYEDGKLHVALHIFNLHFNNISFILKPPCVSCLPSSLISV